MVCPNFEIGVAKIKGRRPLQHILAIFLLTYRNSKHSTTEEPHARSQLHHMHPNLQDTVIRVQLSQVQRRTVMSEREFKVGECVMVRDYQQSERNLTKKYLVDVSGGGM